jgi:Tfp pilus assembly protein FimT
MTTPQPGAPLLRVARNRSGATLLELAVVTLIMGMLAAITLPRFANYVSALRAGSAASQITADVATARMTAVREGRTTSLTLSGTTGYVLAVENTDGTVLRTLRTVRITSTFPGVSVAGNGAALKFDSRGLLRANGITQLTLARGGRQQRLTINAVGRVLREKAQ